MVRAEWRVLVGWHEALHVIDGTVLNPTLTFGLVLQSICRCVDLWLHSDHRAQGWETGHGHEKGTRLGAEHKILGWLVG